VASPLRKRVLEPQGQLLSDGSGAVSVGALRPEAPAGALEVGGAEVVGGIAVVGGPAAAGGGAVSFAACCSRSVHVQSTLCCPPW
jgi:hypothetical protein